VWSSRKPQRQPASDDGLVGERSDLRLTVAPAPLAHHRFRYRLPAFRSSCADGKSRQARLEFCRLGGVVGAPATGSEVQGNRKPLHLSSPSAGAVPPDAGQPRAPVLGRKFRPSSGSATFTLGPVASSWAHAPERPGAESYLAQSRSRAILVLRLEWNLAAGGP
jgi:hypothetical protein